MKRKGQKKRGKITSSKRNSNSKLENFFKTSSNNQFKALSIKPNNLSLNGTNKKMCIVRNPSKTRLKEEVCLELKKYHNLAQKAILCDATLLMSLYTKLSSSFEKIERYLLKNNKNLDTKNISKKQIITKFMLQLKYTDIIFISPSLLNNTFNEEKIAQNIRNFVGFIDKGVTMNFSPNRLNECKIFWPNITEIITNYLDNYHEGKGLYIYVEHDYLSYLNKIKLLCNLNNYETVVIDETDPTKSMILDKVSEAMQTKRLPSISDQLGKQMLLLEEMVNSFSYKWKIFTKIIDNNINIKSINKSNSTNDNTYMQSNEDMSKTINNRDMNNSINNSSYNYSSESRNEPIILSDKEINRVYDEIDVKHDNNTLQYNNKNKELNNYFKSEDTDEDITKNDQLSTSETLFMNFQKKRKNKNKNKEIDSLEQSSEIVLNSRKKSNDKSRDKNKNNSRNKSSELKKRKSKKSNENAMNNKNIKGFFRENTKEHKTFTQIQNNIFLYCTKAKTAIIISDSFSDDEKDKKYFNSILLKISQSKCPIIVLTNNLNYLFNNSQKKIKNLDINVILHPKNQQNRTMIYFYNFIIYINIKLCPLKFTKNITTYEQLLEYISNIDIDLNKYELCLNNLKLISTLSEYLCYCGKFQMDIIDLRLSEIFLEVENEINKKKISSQDFDSILNYIYNIVINKDNNKNNNDIDSEEMNIDEIYNECEIRSFFDTSDGIQENLVNKIYENKLKINDSFDNYCNSKDDMVNLEGLLLNKYFIDKDLIRNKINNNINNINSIDNINSGYKKSFSIYDTFSNKIINKINKEDQLFISLHKRQFIPMSSLINYIPPIKRKLIIKNNLNKYKITSYLENYKTKKIYTLKKRIIFKIINYKFS